MSEDQDIRQLLIEIRDNQRRSLEQQGEHLALAKEQLERARSQVTESIDLQKQAMDRVKHISRIALPALVVCIVLVIFLIARFLV